VLVDEVTVRFAERVPTTTSSDVPAGALEGGSDDSATEACDEGEMIGKKLENRRSDMAATIRTFRAFVPRFSF
jgi:hypothetical protein